MTEFKRNSLTSAVSYRDPASALDWLEKAFGFERAMVITDKDGKDIVLKPNDSIYIAPDEGRSIKNKTQYPASMYVILGYPTT